MSIKILNLTIADRELLKRMLPTGGIRSDVKNAQELWEILDFTEEEAEKYEIQNIFVGLQGTINQGQKRKLDYLKSYDDDEWGLIEVRWNDDGDKETVEITMESEHYNFLRLRYKKFDRFPREWRPGKKVDLDGFENRFDNEKNIKTVSAKELKESQKDEKT